MNIQCRKDSNGLPSQWAKSPKKQSEWSVIFAMLSNIHSYRLLFQRFCPLPYTLYNQEGVGLIWSHHTRDV